MLALAAPAGFVAGWAALGQSPSHLGPWFRHALELESGYSAAMNLAPKTPVLVAALAALALFVAAFFVTAMRARRGLLSWAALIVLAQYVFLAWKEGFTRSGDWHAFVFLWFLPLAWAFCFLPDLWSALTTLQRWVLNATFAGGMALCLVAANFQLPGFAWQQVSGWPRRATHNAQMMVATLRGRSRTVYAASHQVNDIRILGLEHARDVIGNASVDVMNYLAAAAVAKAMNYQPRPVMQGFVAYTPALQTLDEEYFRSAARPQFVMLCQEATDGRFPTLEDSAALNYVLNNYVPVARDGRFLVLQQRTAQEPGFQLVHSETVHFGEKVNLVPWVDGPLFMSVAITPSLWGRLATIVYQQQTLHMRVSTGRSDEQYRLVPSMAERPFLLRPLLNSNGDVINLYAAQTGKAPESVTFERPPHGSFEFEDRITVNLYAARGFLRAAREIPAARMLADVEGRIFWPEPASVASASPVHVAIFHGTPAWVVRAPSKIVLEIPERASLFSGYFGVPDEAPYGGSAAQGVRISIVVQERSGQLRSVLDRVLPPGDRLQDGGRFSFRTPIDGARDRSVTLATSPDASGRGEGGMSVWSQCRFDGSSP